MAKVNRYKVSCTLSCFMIAHVFKDKQKVLGDMNSLIVLCLFILIHFINVSGQYKPDKGKEACQECEDGYYTTQEGTVECTECPAGYFCPVSIHFSPLRLNP